MQQTFDYFVSHDEIDDDTRKRIAELENIDTNREKKYWMADYKQRVGYMEKTYIEYKDKYNYNNEIVHLFNEDTDKISI